MKKISDPLKFQKYLKHKIKIYERAISWQHRQFQSNAKNNSIMHPKLNLEMIIKMTIPETSRYQMKLRRLQRLLVENTKLLRWNYRQEPSEISVRAIAYYIKDSGIFKTKTRVMTEIKNDKLCLYVDDKLVMETPIQYNWKVK